MSYQETIDSLKNELYELSESVTAAISNDGTLADLYGWNFPQVTCDELAQMAENFNSALDSLPKSDGLVEVLESIEHKIVSLRSQVVPYLSSGNGHTISAVAVYMQTFTIARSMLEDHLGWENIPSKEMVPKSLAKRVRGFDDALNSLEREVGDIAAKVKAINEAHGVADSLPTDMEALRKARDEIVKIQDEVKELSGGITKLTSDADEKLIEITKFEKEAKSLVEKCGTAYSITTTVGLAKAFDERAKSLQGSVVMWVFGLIIALLAGYYVGSTSLSHLVTSMSGDSIGKIVMNAILAVLSVGGPVWFAWVATKQIGQRFKLAEDYAFKASVAKAYEGFKKEAERIDPLFEARLFASALTRLEEAPLRLVDDTVHGSPFHEFFSSSGLKKAIELVPELKGDLIAFIKGTREKVGNPVDKAVEAVDEMTSPAKP